MSTTIRTNCPLCGEVDLRPKDIKITPEKDAYVFICTGPCQRRVVKEADQKIIYLLETAGVATQEPPKPLEAIPANLQPFGLDDIIDFHQNFDEELRGLLE